MLITILIVLFLVFAVVLFNWRWGLYLIIFAGFAQDPLRKIITDQPVYFSVIVALVFAVSIVLALSFNSGWRLNHLTLDDQRLEFSTGLFGVFIVFSSIHSYFLYHSPLVSLLGLSVYFAPLAAAVYASIVIDKYSLLRNFLGFYLCCIIAVIASIWLSVYGFEHRILEEVGAGLDVYEHTIRNYLAVHAGIVRTSELAAWHLATGACFSVIMAMLSRSATAKLLYSLLAMVCLVTGLFTGRRKMYGLFIVFCLALVILAISESKSRHRNFTLLSVSFAGIILIALYMTFNQQILLLSFANDYLSRAFTLLGDSVDRLFLTLNAFEYTVTHIGIFGSGAGSSGQGISSYQTLQSSWTGETGLGRIGNELGLLGLAVVGISVISIVFHIVKINRLVYEYDPNFSFIVKALLAFLFANTITYFTAAQTYNDLFVLIILGLVFGVVLGAPKIMYRSLVAR